MSLFHPFSRENLTLFHPVSYGILTLFHPDVGSNEFVQEQRAKTIYASPIREKNASFGVFFLFMPQIQEGFLL